MSELLTARESADYRRTSIRTQDRERAEGQAIDDQTDALAQLQKLADEQRQRAPEFTKEQAFAKVYSDPDNAALVAKERRQNRPRLVG
jgi:hypothetical protein